MSEHTPLTEAEREALLTRVRERLEHEQRWEILGSESNVRCLDCDLRYGERDQYGCHETGRGHTFDEEELAEARTPQADDIDRDLAALLDLAARMSTATADTGLRERVEALRLDVEHSRTVREEDPTITRRDGMPADVGALLRIILDATAAPTTDTGARDE